MASRPCITWHLHPSPASFHDTDVSPCITAQRSPTRHSVFPYLPLLKGFVSLYDLSIFLNLNVTSLKNSQLSYLKYSHMYILTPFNCFVLFVTIFQICPHIYCKFPLIESSSRKAETISAWFTLVPLAFCTISGPQHKLIKYLLNNWTSRCTCRNHINAKLIDIWFVSWCMLNPTHQT